MKLFPAQFDTAVIRFRAVDLTKVDPVHIGLKGPSVLDPSLMPKKIQTSDPTEHPLASVVQGFTKTAYELNGAPPDAAVSALDTLAFAPFASKLRALGGPRTPLQEALQKNHERAVELLSDPRKLIEATGQLIKTSADDLLSEAKRSVLNYVRPQAQVADWLLKTDWSADGLAARRDEVLDSLKSGLAAHKRETHAFAQSAYAGETTAWKGVGSFLAVAATAMINPNKGAVVKALDKPLLITDKRGKDFDRTMKEGWGQLDTRFIFPPNFEKQLHTDLKAGRFAERELSLVFNFPDPQQHGGWLNLSPSTVDVFKRWSNYVLDASKEFIPAGQKPKVGNLSLGWNFAAYKEIAGEKLYNHVDTNFMTASVNFGAGQGTWLFPGVKLPKGARFIGDDQLNSRAPQFSPNGVTSIWSGVERADVDPTVHTSSRLELPPGANKFSAFITITPGK